MKDYGEHFIEGWQQTGDIHGCKFGVWTRIVNGYACNISLGSESKRYWIQAGEVMNGTYATPERAAGKIDLWVGKLSAGPYAQKEE